MKAGPMGRIFMGEKCGRLDYIMMVVLHDKIIARAKPSSRPSPAGGGKGPPALTRRRRVP